MTERASRVALVTGGTGALGSAVATRLAVANPRVHVPWIVEAETSRLEEGWGGQEPVRLHEADVTDEATVARLFGEIADQDGPIDVLANIVSGFEFASIEQTDWSVWMKMMHVNATIADVAVLLLGEDAGIVTGNGIRLAKA